MTFQLVGRRFFAISVILISGAVFFSPMSSARAQGLSEATVHIDRAVIAFEEKRFEDALKELQVALQVEPQNVEALYYQGIVYQTLNRPAEAQAALEKARSLRPANVDVAFQLGTLHFNQQDYDRAEPLLRLVFQSEPSRPNVGYYLGFMEFRKKNYREALRFLDANVPSDDNFAQLARFYSGLAMSSLGFPREGQVAIQQALRLQPVSPLTTPATRFSEVLQSAAERERAFSGELRLGVFYDTNVPAISSAGDIVSQAIQEGQPRQKSEGESVALNLSYVWLRKPDWEGTASYRFSQTYNNHLTEFNNQTHAPTLGIGYTSSLGTMPLMVGSQLSWDYTFLGNKKYSQRWTVNPYATLVESRSDSFSNYTTLLFRLQIKDFFNDDKVSRREVRDAVNYMVGPLHFLVFAGGRHYVKLGYQFDYDQAEGENWTYAGHRALVGGRYTLPWGDIWLKYDLDLHAQAHKFRHSLIPATATGTVKRKDLELVHQVSAGKDFVPDFLKSFAFCGSACSLGASVDYLYDNNRSNLGPFTYKRHVISTSLSWRF